MYDVDKVQYGRNLFPHGVEGGTGIKYWIYFNPILVWRIFLEVQPFFKSLIKETLVDG